MSVYWLLFFMCQDYLQDFWPELQAAHELYSSISQTLQEKESEGSQREFAEHLPAEVLEAGIKSGRYVKVQNKHKSTSTSLLRLSLGQGLWWTERFLSNTWFEGMCIRLTWHQSSWVLEWMFMTVSLVMLLLMQSCHCLKCLCYDNLTLRQHHLS